MSSRIEQTESADALRVVTRAAAIGIVLVVLGHTLPRPLEATRHAHEPAFTSIHQVVEFIYTFHMPLFFVISGVLFMHVERAGQQWVSRGFVRKKAARLLLPYVVISTLAFPLKVLLAAHALHPVVATFSAYTTTLVYPWKNTIIYFWFLVTLFLVFLAAPVMRWLLARRSALVVASVTLVLCGLALQFDRGAPSHATFANWTGALHFLFFFWLGALGHGAVVRLEHAARGWIFLVAGGALLLACAVLFASGVERRLVECVNGVLGSAAVLALARGSLGKSSWTWRLLERNTFQVYLFSWFAQQALRLLLGGLIERQVLVFMALSVVGGIALPVAFAEFLRRLDVGWVSACAGIGRWRAPKLRDAAVRDDASAELRGIRG